MSEETRTLFVGRLDGRLFEAMTVPVPVGASGPVDGDVLIFWHEDGGTVVSLVDTADGSSIELARDEADFATAGMHPDGDDWYWAPVTADGQIDGLWRRSLSGGEAEQVLADRWDHGFSTIHFTLDGSRIAISSYADPGYDYRVVDLASGEVSEILGTGHRSALGFLGDELVVYSAAEPHTEIQLPLIAIDPADGSQRVIVDGEGTYAAILADDEGRPVLVRDSYEQEGYTLYALDEGAATERLLFVGGFSASRPPAQFVRQGVELAGWLPVFPLGAAYVAPGRLDEPSDQPRRLVSLDDGSIIELPERSAEPAG